jgi:hypothetical protein
MVDSTALSFTTSNRGKRSMQEKSNNKDCITRTKVETLTKCHEGKEIDMMEFIHGLSMVVAKNSKTVIRFTHLNTSFI